MCGGSRPTWQRSVSVHDVRGGIYRILVSTCGSTAGYLVVSMCAYPAPNSEAHPSTSPSFFPRDAYSLLSCTPAKVPFFPLTTPMNLTTPCMPPGTSTISPTPMSRPSAPILFAGGDALPTRALRDALRWNAALAVRDKFGDDSAG